MKRGEWQQMQRHAPIPSLLMYYSHAWWQLTACLACWGDVAAAMLSKVDKLQAACQKDFVRWLMNGRRLSILADLVGAGTQDSPPVNRMANLCLVVPIKSSLSLRPFGFSRRQ